MDDQDFIPLYGLQSFVFCQRQFALEFSEQLERVNWRVADGRVFHKRVDQTHPETRRDVHLATSLKLSSVRYGLVGVADMVEFHRVPEPMALTNPPLAVKLPNRAGWWMPFPIEYKRGKPKSHRADEVQLCAQALCLEEMLHVSIHSGALFYGSTRRRQEVPFDAELRNLTIATIQGAHTLLRAGDTPPPVITPSCKACSLCEYCFIDNRSAHTWIQKQVDAISL